MDATLAQLLHVSDSAFPTGAYAHSMGLEQVCAMGFVHDEATLLDYLQTEVMESLERFELPCLRIAMEMLSVKDWAALAVFSGEVNASYYSNEMRTANLALGRRRLHILLRLHPGSAEFEEISRRAKTTPEMHQQVIVAAAQATHYGFPRDSALQAHALQTVANHATASLKLIRIGQEGCHAVISQCLNSIANCIDNSLHIRREEAGVNLPLADIGSCQHAHAFSRLFIS